MALEWDAAECAAISMGRGGEDFLWSECRKRDCGLQVRRWTVVGNASESNDEEDDHCGGECGHSWDCARLERWNVEARLVSANGALACSVSAYNASEYNVLARNVLAHGNGAPAGSLEAERLGRHQPEQVGTLVVKSSKALKY